jgi:undecaprenyl-phosphate 4-deoxy-4-formamido-L-arabinose transferase
MTVELSIVVPVYRSENILAELVEQVGRSVGALGLAGQFELLLVNDASPDGSWKVITGLAKRYDYVRGICLQKNFGQHSATMAGLNHVRGKIIIVMDDDLQHPPAAIGDLMQAIKGGADVCYTRYRRRQHALWKVLGSRFNDWVACVLLDKPRGLYLSSFKAMRRALVQQVIKYDGPFTYLDGLILDATRSITVIDIDHQPRHQGAGNYNLGRSVALWLRMVTNFSVFPLRLATFVGFSLTLLSFLVIAVVVLNKLAYPEIEAGWTSMIAVILFVGGVQTFCIGMLGEYLGRAYLKINGKPQYVVRSMTWSDEDSE